MPRTPTRGPSNNWNLSEEQLESLRRYYVDENLSVQQAARRLGLSSTVAQQIVKHHGWALPPDPANSEIPNEPQ